MKDTTTGSAPVCATCNDHGMIGGPSYSQPDEGGEPCPECTAPVSPAASVPSDVIARLNGCLEHAKWNDGCTIHHVAVLKDDLIALLAAYEDKS